MLSTKQIREDQTEARERIHIQSNRAFKTEDIIQGLCDEIDQLRKSPQPPTHVGRIIDKQQKEIAELRIDVVNAKISAKYNFDLRKEQEKEIARLKAELGGDEGIYKKAFQDQTTISLDRRDVICKQEKEITELKEKFKQVASVAQTASFHADRFRLQEKEIAELKAQINTLRSCRWVIPYAKEKAIQQKEITELKAELVRQCKSPNGLARRKLTEVIKEVLEEGYYLRRENRSRNFDTEIHIASRAARYLREALEKYGTK